MPTYVHGAAIVMRPKRTELQSCQASTSQFRGVWRGTISYYATATLLKAKTIRSWQLAISKRMRSDNNDRPLQVIGNASILFPE